MVMQQLTMSEIKEAVTLQLTVIHFRQTQYMSLLRARRSLTVTHCIELRLPLKRIIEPLGSLSIAAVKRERNDVL